VTQSPSTRQPTPGPQGAHESPPQSMPVSRPLSAQSAQLGFSGSSGGQPPGAGVQLLPSQ
jgi:hypothetical protein